MNSRTILYWLMILFIVFLISTGLGAGATGEQADDFFSWVAGGWDATTEFVGDLLDEDSQTGS